MPTASTMSHRPPVGIETGGRCCLHCPTAGRRSRL